MFKEGEVVFTDVKGGSSRIDDQLGLSVHQYHHKTDKI